MQQVAHNDPYCLMPGELVPKPQVNELVSKPQVIELFSELARPTFIHNKVHIYSFHQQECIHYVFLQIKKGNEALNGIRTGVHTAHKDPPTAENQSRPIRPLPC